MRNRRPFFKQKPRLYFDESCPDEILTHFGSGYWIKKISATSAVEEGNASKSDRFHYNFCNKHNLSLVTLDADFSNDRLYPFTNGKMAGIVVLKASSSEIERIIDMLSPLMTFLLSLPFPKAFMTETKFIVGRDGVMMRGRDSATNAIKSLKVVAGRTTTREIRRFFNY